MTVDNLDYFQKRAETELALAQSAEHANAVRAHYLLAGYYLDLVHNEEARAALEGADEGPAGIDAWVIRYAARAAQEHGEMTPEHVATRIQASRTRGDSASARLWEELQRMVTASPLATAPA